MFSEVLPDRLTESSRAEAVDDPHRLLSFEQRAIEELVGLLERIVNTLTNQVELRGNRRSDIR